MRRAFLTSSAVAMLGAIASCVSTPPRPSYAARILGAWRLDRTRTEKFWRGTPEHPAISALSSTNFRRLTFHITTAQWQEEYDDITVSHNYSVVGADPLSVVVLHAYPGVPAIKQYFIEKEFMYVANGFNVEFYDRVEP